MKRYVSIAAVFLCTSVVAMDKGNSSSPSPKTPAEIDLERLKTSPQARCEEAHYIYESVVGGPGFPGRGKRAATASFLLSNNCPLSFGTWYKKMILGFYADQGHFQKLKATHSMMNIFKGHVEEGAADGKPVEPLLHAIKEMEKKMEELTGELGMYQK